MDVFKRDCKDCIHFNPERLQDENKHHCLKWLKCSANLGCSYYEEHQDNGEMVMVNVKTTIDMFYEMALMAFYDGHIAIYVDNEETADVLYRFCWDYPVEMDYPNGEGRGIQIDYTYKIAFVEYVNRHTGQKGTRRILLRYKGKNDACKVDILNAGNVLRKD